MANKAKAKAFVEKWMNKGDEKQDTSRFWHELLQEVYGDSEVHNDTHLSFEVPTGKNNKKGKEFKDVVINRRSKNATLIEQKSFDIDLDHKSKQSDGSLLTPFEQAKKYDDNSAYDDKARWIITCNFQEFRIYDMKKEGIERYKPVILKLEELPSNTEWLDFLLFDSSAENQQFNQEVTISKKGGDLIGKMYDALLKRYSDPKSEHTQKELNKLCVRLVFCLYADDAGLFDKNDTNKFENYIKNTEPKYIRQALIDLFKVLDQKEEERDKYLDDKLKSFPYVNGGLFKGEVEIPNFDDALKKLLIEEESAAFDWSEVSPTIFGAVFESTLNTETRRNGGMHYTSIENIHKVIDPLFLDDLRNDLNDALSYSVASKKEKALLDFQNKLSTLTFMDPACGSGNFLTETYLSLRRLENEVIRQLQGINVALNFENDSVIKVSIQQFYGIEINDFAVAVAKTALWIAESQMFKETESILAGNREYFPLQAFNNVLEGNALQIDWNEIVSRDKLNYIMGNPPFLGYKYQNGNQKNDLIKACGDDTLSTVDYVSGWYYKAANYIKGTKILCCYVSTNSITQGEQVNSVWYNLINKYHVIINFAYRTFRWDSEANEKAHVHCVIIGFSYVNNSNKVIIDGTNIINADNINPYLIDGKNIFIKRRSMPLQDVQIMQTGSEPRDGGFLILSLEEKEELLNESSNNSCLIKRFFSADDFINNKERYCLWINDSNINIAKKSNIIKQRLKQVEEFRIASKQKQAHEMASIPYQFVSERQPKTRYLLIPSVSSERRKYIPIGYMNSDDIVSNSCSTIENATLYTFGILTSSTHMAWMRAVCGRLETRYSYKNTIVYNNFVWPTPPAELKEKIEQTAQKILDIRALQANKTFADLYDPLFMPAELKKAHEENDKVVMEAYGFNKNMSESEIVAELFKRYEKLIQETKK